jgi:RNA polymerase sigma-70 factor, ECF subfamily
MTTKIAQSAQHGEEAAALRRQMAELIPDLRVYARFLARDRAEADDLVQEALVRALGKLATFQAGMSVKPWLFTVLRNAFFEQARRRRIERASIAMVAHEKGEPSVPAQQEERHTLADLQRFVWQLPPLQREALVLIGAHGLDYEQAAVICTVPVGTMKARVARARAQIQRLMEHETTPSRDREDGDAT